MVGLCNYLLLVVLLYLFWRDCFYEWRLTTLSRVIILGVAEIMALREARALAEDKTQQVQNDFEKVRRRQGMDILLWLWLAMSF